MKASTSFIGIAIGLVLIIVAFSVYKNAHAPTTPLVENIKGCYSSIIQKDVYTLNIQVQSEEKFIGTLKFKNFEKDSSSGTYVGTYKNNILSGEYIFQSEGSTSTMLVMFKKIGDDFIRGIEVDNGITYDETVPGSHFKKAACL